jgi:hypothetical protein
VIRPVLTAEQPTFYADAVDGSDTSLADLPKRA